jgi:hypothetical protein
MDDITEEQFQKVYELLNDGTFKIDEMLPSAISCTILSSCDDCPLDKGVNGFIKCILSRRRCFERIKENKLLPHLFI